MRGLDIVYFCAELCLGVLSRTTAECRVALSLLRVPILFPFALGQLRLGIALCLVELLGHDSTSVAVVVVSALPIRHEAFVAEALLGLPATSSSRCGP